MWQVLAKPYAFNTGSLTSLQSLQNRSKLLAWGNKENSVISEANILLPLFHLSKAAG